MSDPREQLKSVVQDLIADKREQAEVTIHQYLVAKTQQMSGLASAHEVAPEQDTDPVE